MRINLNQILLLLFCILFFFSDFFLLKKKMIALIKTFSGILSKLKTNFNKKKRT